MAVDTGSHTLVIPWPEYAPDRALLDPTASQTIRNVLPAETGYRPHPSLSVYSTVLPEAPRGGILAITLGGSYVVHAYTAVGAYSLESDLTWTDRTRGAGPYNLAAGDTWSSTQFGDTVVIGNVNDAPQKFTLASSTDYEALGGSPPQARYWGVQGDYLLGLSTASNPNRIHRSGLNNIEWWQYGLGRGSDYQDLPDGGPITGMAGSERGAVIFSRDTVRLFQDLPGSPVLFTLSKADPARGAIAPQSIVNAGGGAVYYLAESGFRRFDVNGSISIGEGRVDRTFLADCSSRTLVQGVYDPQNDLIFWQYQATDSTYKIIGYSPRHDRFFPVAEDVVFLIQAATVSTTLEAINTVHGYTTLESVPFSFDSLVWKGGRPLLGAFNSEFKLCLFNGPALEATLQTPDLPLGGEGMKGYVAGFRPVGDASGVTGRVGSKATYADAISWSVTRDQNSLGTIPIRAAGQTLRFEETIPAGTVWRHSIGVEPEGVRTAGRQ